MNFQHVKTANDPSLFYSTQARLKLRGHAEHHACGVGEDLLQLARTGPLLVDPGGPAGAPWQRF